MIGIPQYLATITSYEIQIFFFYYKKIKMEKHDGLLTFMHLSKQEIVNIYALHMNDFL